MLGWRLCLTKKLKTMWYFLFILWIFICPIGLRAENYQPKFSTAGFYTLPNTGRTVSSMNLAWRFYKGAQVGAEAIDFDDKDWDLVSIPHGIELLPTEASGCINYQGEVWYRKHFTPSNEWTGKQLFLHFEAIMGKSKIWVNGELLAEHFGGFLPVVVDVTTVLKYGEDNVIAVWADNSDDPSYPPGKFQDVLDFTYCGGIYRDCWLIAHHPVFITDANYENEVAGGGLFVSYDNVSEKSARINMTSHIRNLSGVRFNGSLQYELYDKEGVLVLDSQKKIQVANKQARTFNDGMTLKEPHLWSPDSPYLYHLRVYVKNAKGEVVDGFYRRIGIRSIEFKGEDGFWLNGKPYEEPLIGANRHQDFAVIGNALSNSLHWRDAKKLRDAGLRVIRNAHYPQDPAFMDACDELGLFVIVNTPGWQFWNDAPSFAEYVYSDIRNMVRRDRNHASVWMWEPILNETWYPEDFAKKVKGIVEEEYPYPYCYSGCDATARGHEYYPVQFTHPINGGGGGHDAKELDKNVTYYTREWGDNVDDWNSHNSPSRVNRGWGEVPMLIQANGYAKTSYKFTTYDELYRTSKQHIGGCLWHSFDHQRGYHPDPFYGGIMDAFRQPKLSYYMFCSQRDAIQNNELISETGPMVYIANIMSPFSPKDVTIFSNCDEVRLTDGKNGKVYHYKKDKTIGGMPSPVIVFEDVFDVMEDKALARSKRHSESYLLAEGLINGEVVATHQVFPARRPTKIKLWVDDENVKMKANGSDMVTVIAAITDDNGNIKRLNNYAVYFTIEGEGELVGNPQTFTNPRPIQWGTAPILVRSTANAGTIKVKASVVWEGTHTPISAEIDIPTYESEYSLVVDDGELEKLNTVIQKAQSNNVRYSKDLRVINNQKLKEVEKQQAEFE